MRLIDADSTEKYFYEHLDDLHMKAAQNAIDEMPTIEITELNLYGHSIKDLIVVAELYKKKGIMLDDNAKAFKQGYLAAKRDFEEALQNTINNMIGGAG